MFRRMHASFLQTSNPRMKVDKPTAIFSHFRGQMIFEINMTWGLLIWSILG